MRFFFQVLCIMSSGIHYTLIAPVLYNVVSTWIIDKARIVTEILCNPKQYNENKT